MLDFQSKVLHRLLEWIHISTKYVSILSIINKIDEGSKLD